MKPRHSLFFAICFLPAACSSSTPSEAVPTDASSGTVDAASDITGAVEVLEDGGPSSDAGASSDAGPDGAAPDDAEFVSGTRIRATYWLAEDGTRRYTGLFDTKLQVACSFSKAEDGKVRCLPMDTADAANVFADMNCMQPLGHVDAQWCTTPKYGMQPQQAAGCAAGPIVYALGASVNLATIYNPAGANCNPSPAAGQKLFDLGSKVAPTEFVEGTTVQEASGRRIATTYIVGADGSKSRRGLFDTKLGVSCYVGVAADGERRCLPDVTAGFIGDFADMGCTMPLVLGGSSPCNGASAAYGQKVDNGVCPNRLHIFPLGSKFTGTQVFRGMSCLSGAPLQGFDYYALGAEVDPTSFDKFTEMKIGTTRLQITAVVDAEGARQETYFLYDSLRKEPCSFSKVADGSTRCVPSYGLEYFTDDKCMSPLIGAGPADCESPLPLYGAWNDTGCAGGLRFYAFGSKVAKPASLFATFSAACSTVSTSNTDFFMVGAEIPASSFVGATLMTE
jgi:hypothetical protein